MNLCNDVLYSSRQSVGCGACRLVGVCDAYVLVWRFSCGSNYQRRLTVLARLWANQRAILGYSRIVGLLRQTTHNPTSGLCPGCCRFIGRDFLAFRFEEMVCALLYFKETCKFISFYLFMASYGLCNLEHPTRSPSWRVNNVPSTPERHVLLASRA